MNRHQLKKTFDNLKIVYTSQKRWKSSLLKQFRESGNDNPFRRILDAIEKQQCQSIIIEREYIDLDYLSEFEKFYATTFSSHPKECTRLHFFTSKVTENDYLNLSKHQKYYLGFMIIRPIDAFKTGRTVIRGQFRNPNTNFILTKATFKVNLSGTSLQIEGMPFIQQDTNVGVCAQASIWMASLYMHQKFGYSRWLPSKITETATRYISIGAVKDGLTEDQMIQVLRDMDFNPILIESTPNVRETAKQIYSYVESEIPVLLLLNTISTAGIVSGHVVTAIGHTFNPDSTPIFDEYKFAHNIDWIKEFYIHDDADGPLRTISLFKDDSSYSVEENLDSFLVPLPRGISLRSEEAEIYAKNFIRCANQLFTDLNSTDYCFTDDELSKLVLRVYLRLSNKYKEALSKSDSDIHDSLRAMYRAKRFPRYIWVVEISKEELLNKHKNNDRRIIGEIIIDPSGSEEGYKSVLCFHLYDRVILRNSISDSEYSEFTLHKLKNWAPYRHLVRG